MTQKLVNQLKSHLNSIGLLEGEDFYLSAEGDNVNITVSIPVEVTPLPAELQPYATDRQEVERAIRKQSTEKRSINGATFELALADYMNDLLAKDPEAIELRKTLHGPVTKKGFDEYRAKTDAIWARINLDPRIVALEQDLEENYL